MVMRNLNTLLLVTIVCLLAYSIWIDDFNHSETVNLLFNQIDMLEIRLDFMSETQDEHTDLLQSLGAELRDVE